MSAINLLTTRDAVHLFTDGALADEFGNIQSGLDSKVFPVPHYDAVIATTGFSWIGRIVVELISSRRFAGIDDLAKGLPDVIRKFAIDNPTGANDLGWGLFQVVLAGWSRASNAPVSFIMRNYVESGLAEFEMGPIDQLVNPYLPASAGVRIDLDRPEETGLRIMEAQRRHEYQFAARGVSQTYLARGALGFCQHTRIDGEGIAIRVVKRWPSAAGTEDVPGVARLA